MTESKCSKCVGHEGCVAPIHHQEYHYVVHDFDAIQWKRTIKADVQDVCEKICQENPYPAELENRAPDPLKSRMLFLVDINSHQLQKLYTVYHRVGQDIQRLLVAFLAALPEGTLQLEMVDSAIQWRDVPETHPASLALSLLQTVISEHGHPVSAAGKVGDVTIAKLAQQTKNINPALKDAPVARASEGDFELIAPEKVPDEDDEPVH